MPYVLMSPFACSWHMLVDPRRWVHQHPGEGVGLASFTRGSLARDGTGEEGILHPCDQSYKLM
jgi:hypothetical protein